MSAGLYTAFFVGTLTVVGWCTEQEFVATTTVTTDKEMYYVGEIMTVHCFLSRRLVCAASFHYGLDTMPSDYVKVVNETYLRLDKQLTETDPSEAVCACYVAKEENETIVGSLIIYTEYRPQNVTNLNYEYCNINDLSVSWSLGKEYKLRSSITVITAEYANDSSHGPWMKCDLWQNGTGCVARNLSGWTQLSLRVAVTNVLRNDTAVTLFDRLALVSDEGITTDKPLYYVGENMTVHCFLNRPAAGAASFSYGPDTMSRDYVKVVNRTYLRLHKQLTETDLSETICACFVEDEMMGNRPQGVTNLNYTYCNETDFCASWSLGVEYRLGLHTERQRGSTTVITAEYANNSDHGPWMKCDLWQNGTGCVARNLSGWTPLSLRVAVTNLLRNDTAVTLFDRLALVSGEEITTDKPLYYVGENMTVHCFLNRPAAGAASFSYGPDTMSRDYVKVVNRTYLRLDKQLTETDLSETICACFVEDEMMGSVQILTEYRPQGVTNLNYTYCNETDFCASWSLGVEYRLGLHTERQRGSTTVITAEYANNSDHGPWMNCDLKQNGTGCVARNLSGWTQLSLRVAVTNVLRNDTAVTLFDDLALVSDGSNLSPESFGLESQREIFTQKYQRRASTSDPNRQTVIRPRLRGDVAVNRRLSSWLVVTAAFIAIFLVLRRDREVTDYAEAQSRTG